MPCTDAVCVAYTAHRHSAASGSLYDAAKDYLVATFIHYPFMVTLRGLGDWFAFLEQVLLTM